jgi:hypothetical protein
MKRLHVELELDTTSRALYRLESQLSTIRSEEEHNNNNRCQFLLLAVMLIYVLFAIPPPLPGKEIA